MVGHRVLPTVRLVGGVCSVAAHVAWERARRSPRRTELDTVPASAERLTPESLTAALCRTVPRARVTDLVLGGGSDGSSARRSVTVTYNDVGARPACRRRFSRSRLLGSPIGSCWVSRARRGNECFFYNECRPALSINSPIGYYAAVDAGSKRSMILTDDVGRTRGATFGDALQTLTRADAEDMSERHVKLSD
jgi:hypothetical protein